MNNKELKIVITQKDLKRYKIAFTDSGMIIDELAYASKQWTSDELWENNIDGEPYKPYNFNYEDELFTATKTDKKLYAIAKELKISLNANWEKIARKQKLQSGACIALNNPEAWQELLEAYKTVLEDQRTDGISKAYNEQLQKELDSFADDQYREWLYGDHRDYAGVIAEIRKFWEAEYVQYDDKKGDSFTFFFDKEYANDEMLNYDGSKSTAKNYKTHLLCEIKEASEARQYKEKQEAEKRKLERERLSQYKKEQATQAEAERKAKLLSMTNKR